MKKLFGSLICASLLLTSGIAALSSGLLTKEKDQTIQAEAATDDPGFTIDTSRIMKWKWDDDPDSGTEAIKWSDGKPDTTTIEYIYGAPSASQSPYIMIDNPNNTQKFHAMYVPFSITFPDVQSLQIAKEVLSFKLSLYRTKPGSASSADFSIELFAFGEDSSLCHTTYWYIQNDMTTTTGRGYSLYRLASETQVTDIYENVSYNYEKQNSTYQTQGLTLWFGVFAYMESSAVNSRLQAKVELRSRQRVTNSVKYTIGDKCFTNFGDAVTEYNKTSGQTIKARVNDQILLANTYNLTQNGTIDMNGFTMSYTTSNNEVGSYLILLTTGKTLTVTNGTIESRLGTTIWVMPSATLTVTSSGRVGNTSSTINYARAVYLQGNDSYESTLYVEAGGVVSGSKVALRFGKGRAYVQGQLSSTNYAVFYESSSYVSYLYMYGGNAYINGTVYMTAPEKCYLYCKYNGTGWTNSCSFLVELGTIPSINQRIIRNVDDASKTIVALIPSEKHYRLAVSGSYYVFQYIDYTVSYSFGGDFSVDGLPTTTNYSSNLSFTLVPTTNSYLPDSISIYSGTTQLTAGTHYTYNTTTGAVEVIKEYITANVTVSARSAPTYLITFSKDSDYVGTMNQVRIKRGSTYTLPECGYTKPYHSFRTWSVLNNERAPGYTFTPSTDVVVYALWSQSNEQKIDYFIGVKLHFDKDVVDINNNNDTGACKGDEGYYAVAKTYYNSMNSTLKTMFCENAEYANGRARFIAWARANGEDLNLDTHAIVQLSNNSVSNYGSSDINSAIIAIVTVTIVSTGMCFGLLIFKKRKHN